MASKPKAHTREQQFDALCARLRTQLSREEIAELPPFEEHNRTVTLVQEHNFASALAHLKKARYLGFDMEAKPTFLKGQKEHATSLIQMVTRTKCFIFFVAAIPQIGQLRSILENPTMVKVGIGLKSDRHRLTTEFGMQSQSLVDVSEIFSLMGRKNNIGSKQLVAHCLKKNLRKSKKISVPIGLPIRLKNHRLPTQRTTLFLLWMRIWSCAGCCVPTTSFSLLVCESCSRSKVSSEYNE